METENKFSRSENLGNPGRFMILKLVQKVIKTSGTAANIVRRPVPSDESLYGCQDVSFAKEHIVWQLPTSIDERLEQVISYFQSVLRT